MIISDETVKKAPGLLGRIVSYIEETCIYSQPSLSLAAGLTLLSVLKGHKVRSQSNLRTNLLTVCLAPSGSGKGHAFKVINRLLEASEYDYLLAGRPASDSGLLDALSTTGRKLICWDEFGLALKGMTESKAPFYKSNILSVLMDTFSAADILYRGSEYKQQASGKSSRTDIKTPCLSLYGLSTPLRFFESLNSANVMDGFLPRLLIFEGKESAVKDDKECFEIGEKIITRKKFSVDASLVEEIRQAFPQGNLSKSHMNRKATKVLEFSEENGSAAVFYYVHKMYEDLKVKAENEQTRAIYSRAAEHFIKLCLVVEEEEIITGFTASWVEGILKTLVQTSIDAVTGRIYNSKAEKENHELTEIIRRAKTITRSELTRKTQYLKNFEREDILKNLIQSEIVEAYQDFTGLSERRKRTVFYRIRA